MPEAKRDIKARIQSIEGTKKITKAMGLVASSKITRAKERIEKSRPYFHIMYETLTDIASASTDFSSLYLNKEKVNSETVCLVVIGGDRGLAGGYNHNVLGMANQASQDKKVKILPIGKKVFEYYKQKDFEILTGEYSVASELTVGMCFEISRYLCDAFLKGQFDEILLVYTNFVSILEQNPATIDLLPLYHHDIKTDSRELFIYEPSTEEVYDAIVPEYVAGLIYGALCEAQASEHAARHTAMDSASNNAEEIIDTLNLKYNKARQGAITQEITEIVAGSEE